MFTVYVCVCLRLYVCVCVFRCVLVCVYWALSTCLVCLLASAASEVAGLVFTRHATVCTLVRHYNITEFLEYITLYYNILYYIILYYTSMHARLVIQRENQQQVIVVTW